MCALLMFMVTMSVDLPVWLGTLTGVWARLWILLRLQLPGGPVTSGAKRSTIPVLGAALIPFIFKNRLYILKQF